MCSKLISTTAEHATGIHDKKFKKKWLSADRNEGINDEIVYVLPPTHPTRNSETCMILPELFKPGDNILPFF